MKQAIHIGPQQISVDATLDVQSVERELTELWMETSEESAGEDEGAVMRARVLNLMIYVSTETSLLEVDEMLGEIAAVHPCRALVMLAEPEKPNQDIEMFISAHCHAHGGGRNLCGEQVTLKARGRFTVELPSAATPLLVPDLPVFLWWRDALRLQDQIFASLSRASDRVIIDSADFLHPYQDMLELDAVLQQRRGMDAALSDLNWARLTAWRMLLASFYDVDEYREALKNINRVRIEYVPHNLAATEIAPKALILAGWLMSRLGWRRCLGSVALSARSAASGAQAIEIEREGHVISLEFEAVERPEAMQGWIARIELSAEQGASRTRFVVLRSEDGRFLQTDVSGAAIPHVSRVLYGGDRSEAELAGRELEIITHDRIYEEAIRSAASILQTA